MTNYEIGFLNKCAEHGLDADVSMALLEKQALKAPKGKAGRIAVKARKFMGHLTGSTARKAKRRLDSAVAWERSARADLGKVREAYNDADSLHARVFKGRGGGKLTDFENDVHRKWLDASDASSAARGRYITRMRDTDAATRSYDNARHARNVARAGTAAGVAGVAGTAGVAKAVSKGRGKGQEKKSEAYLRGFAEKCAEYGFDDSQSLELLKRAYHIGPFRGVNGSVGDTGFSAGFGGGTVHAGIENPGRGGFAIGGHTSRELNHNAAAGAIAGALIGLLREKFRGENEKKHYLRSALLGSLLGGGAGGAYTMATSAPSAVDAISGLLGKAKGKVDKAGDAIG